MGFIFSFIKRLFTLLLRVVLKVFIYFFIFASIIVLLPNLPPYTSFTKIDLEPTLPREGPLAPNNDLNNLEKLYTEKLVGPECFQLHNGQVYTTLATGEIVKLSPGNHVTFVAQIGKPCAGIKEEHICGRPLGFEIVEKKNLLYVADAYYGIWSVDLKTNKKTLLVSPHVEINGQLPKLFNSLALDSKGNLYYTDSNTDFQLNNGGFAVLTDPTGRLFQYNAAKNESKVLLDKLWLANGLVVSPNDEFIVVAESNAYRLMKYYLNGPKKGQKEVLIAGLPGAPDNLRALPDGSGLQAALYMSHGADEPMLGHSLAAAPLVRKFLVRTQYLLQLGFQFLNQQFPHVIFEDAIYNIGHFRSLSNLMTNSSALLHIDWNGNIKKAYFHTQGEIHISDALLYNDKVYLGAPHGQNFVAAVPAPPAFKKAFTPKDQPQVKKEVPAAQSAPKHTEQPKQAPTPTPIKIVPVEQKAEAPKTTQPPPKPTQQPPKPTQQPPKPAQQAQQPPKQAQQTQQPPKPAQQAQQPPKPTQQTQPPSKPAQEPPKPTQQPPKTAQQPPKPTPSPPKPAEQPAKQTPPPVQSTTQKPVQKKVDAPPSPTAKPKEQKPAPTKPVEKKQQKPDAAAPQQIPITEEIPSDTIKPSKETLKVIKKAGPTEIPNPEL